MTMAYTRKRFNERIKYVLCSFDSLKIQAIERFVPMKGTTQKQKRTRFFEQLLHKCQSSHIHRHPMETPSRRFNMNEYKNAHTEANEHIECSMIASWAYHFSHLFMLCSIF